MTKKPAKPYSAMNKAELVRALTQRDRTIAKLEKQIDQMQAIERHVDNMPEQRTTLPRNPMPWKCSQWP